MEANPFVLEKNEYRRDLRIFEFYKRDAATYLSAMTNKPIEECRAFVEHAISKDGRFPFRDPRIIYLEREDNGDRVKKEGTLGQYLQDALENQELIAPTLTTYIPPHKIQSLLVNYIDGNVKARGVAKKAMFAAEMAKDVVLYSIKKNEQNNRKLGNNAISGAHVSPSTPLYNRTAHSTLTSNCRSTSGYGNANNEKFLSGNRHYWSPDIVEYNIVSIINNVDYEMIQQAIDVYGIKYPVVDEVMECIKFSTKKYWRSRDRMMRIKKLVERLTPIQRAAFVYVGDLYHLKQLNPELVGKFIKGISSYKTGEIENAVAVLKAQPEDNVHLAVQICSPDMKGKRLYVIPGMADDGKNATDEARANVALTALGIADTVKEFGLLIKAFWVTDNMPASVAYFPESIRHAALTSDTDSTIFTVQDWVEWYCGSIKFDQEANSVAAAMIWLSAQSIIHLLARMSANFGIENARIHQIAMKNEFKFDVFVPTQVAKHYFALIGCQEGNLFDKYKKEIKGVHLKSSNAPVRIMEQATTMMTDIMNDVIAGKKISLKAMLTRVADIERSVYSDIRNGGSEYFRKGQIKQAASYTKGPMESNYIFYSMWEDVFSPKYGSIQEPPYMCLKFATDLDTPSKTKTWLDSLEDRDLANRMAAWMQKYNKKYIGLLQLPEQAILQNGIPTEVLSAMNVRKIVADTCSVFYLILETLGYYCSNDKLTRLVSDQY